MDNTFNSSEHNINPALKYTWSRYREYAATSRSLNKKLSNWRLRIFILSISGAILGTLCQESIRIEMEKLDYSWISEELSLLKILFKNMSSILGFLSAAALALATYYGKEIVNSDQERNWIKVRSLAETFKRQAFLFVTNASPYDVPEKESKLLSKSKKLSKSLENLKKTPISEEDKLKFIPPNTLTVDEYVQERVQDQIDFYIPKSNNYSNNMNRNKSFGILLGTIATLLGLIGSTTGWTAGWIAVIITVTASITSFVYAKRYQYLIISYQRTADQLEFLKAEWDSIRKTNPDIDEQNNFIQKCENVLASENSAWVAEFAK